jgi:hypothetical protein
MHYMRFGPKKEEPIPPDADANPTGEERRI